MSKLIFRTSAELKNIKKYRCDAKSKTANSRFEDQISKEVVLDVLERFKYRCFYCYNVLKPNKWQLDHFYARATGGKNVYENLVCSCKWCNTMKNALDGHSFISKCFNVVENNHLSIHGIDLKLIDKHRNKQIKKNRIKTL